MMKVNEKYFSSNAELRIKKAICQLLIDRKHRKFAEVLWGLDFEVVEDGTNGFPDPFVAAISFENGVVYVSKNFFVGSTTIFNQLDVVMRHELAHNLMRHELRMLAKFKEMYPDEDDETYQALMCSNSLHDIQNVIMDFEISNTRYTSADEVTIRNMVLNGKLLGGLLTSEHRAEWKTLSLEEMYDKWDAELKALFQKITSSPNWQPRKTANGNPDYLEVTGFNDSGFKGPDGQVVDSYLAADMPSMFNPKRVDDLIKKGLIDKKMAPQYAKVVKDVYNGFTANGTVPVTNRMKRAMHKATQEIARTAPTEVYKLDTGNGIVKLFTPEQKVLARHTLNNMLGFTCPNFVQGWNTTMTNLDKKEYSVEDLQKALDSIRGN